MRLGPAHHHSIVSVGQTHRHRLHRSDCFPLWLPPDETLVAVRVEWWTERSVWCQASYTLLLPRAWGPQLSQTQVCLWPCSDCKKQSDCLPTDLFCWCSLNSIFTIPIWASFICGNNTGPIRISIFHWFILSFHIIRLCLLPMIRFISS